MTIEWHDIAGSVGVLLILGAYLLLQLGRIQSDFVMFSAANALGSGLIILSLLQSFNLSAFVIEVCWLLISLYGMAVNRFGRRHRHGRFPQ